MSTWVDRGEEMPPKNWTVGRWLNKQKKTFLFKKEPTERMPRIDQD